MSYYDPLVYAVPPEQSGMRLKAVLHGGLRLSRRLVARLKKTEKGITVNGERRFTDALVYAGDLIEIRMERECSEDILPQAIPFGRMYEDDHLLIVDKSAGMIVHPTHGHYVGTLANAVVYHWRQKGEEHRFRPVHRLDRETSGVLAVAKNPYAHQQLSEQMSRGTVEKTYLALVCGSPPLPAGVVNAPIGRDPLHPHRRIATPRGARATTRYALAAGGPEASLLRIDLETGRTHQIRVHMQALGCPLLGDSLYGVEAEGLERSPLRGRMNRHALHAWKLAFDHPASGERMTFTSPLPEDMKQCMEDLSLRGDFAPRHPGGENE